MPPTSLSKLRKSKAKSLPKDDGKKKQNQFGFTFATPTTIKTNDPVQFHKDLVAQRDAVGLVQAKFIQGVDRNGVLDGTDLRLTSQAFGQLCHAAEVPVKFIKKLCEVEPDTALDAMQAMIRKVFHGGALKMLVTDERDQSVLGVVGEKTYKPFDNVAAFDAAMQSMKAVELTTATLDGGQMRASFVDPDTKRDVHPKSKNGDIIQFGVAAGNSIDGSTSAYIEEFNLRLVCTNGMTRRDKGGRFQYMHRNDDLSDVYAASALAISKNYEQTCALMEASANATLETEDAVNEVMAFVADARNGGGKLVAEAAFGVAQDEATKEGGNPDRPTLWNIVNGVTQVGRDTERTQKRTNLEALGYRTMMRFGVPLLNS